MSETNEQAKHTPGPWEAKLEGAWGWCVKAGKRYIAFRIHKEADTRLIAAAPELLAACKQAEWQYEQLGDSKAIKMLRAAIAKAEGR